MDDHLGGVAREERLRLAEAVRAACLDAARRAFEEGGYAGLCEEGRRELALDAIASVALAPLLDPPAGIGPLTAYLRADHERIDALLDAAVADPERFDHDAFEQARAGLLRHIGIEEKILLPYARRRRGGEPLALASVLRRDHGAIASLLVPTPDHALVRELRSILVPHDELEEAPGGLYAILEALAGDDAEELLARARAAPAVPTAKHFDGPRATRTAREALARSDASARAIATDEPSD